MSGPNDEMESVIRRLARARELGGDVEAERAWEVVVEALNASANEPRVGLDLACVAESELEAWQVLEER